MAGERPNEAEGRVRLDPAWMEHCSELLDAFPRGLLVLDASGSAVYANSASAKLLGRPEARLVGRMYDEDGILGDALRMESTGQGGGAPIERAQPDSIEHALRSGEPSLAVHVTIDRPTAGRKYLSLDVIPLHASLGGIAGAAVVLSDETADIALRSESAWLRNDLVRVRREAEELLRLSESLNAINDTIHSTLEFPEVLQRVVKTAALTLGVGSALVEMREDTSWMPRAVFGLPDEVAGRRITAEEAPHASIVAETRGPLTAEIAADARLANDYLRSLGARSLLAVPLLVRGEVVGVLSFFTSHTWHFTADRLSFASKVAATTSLAMENARVYAEERHIADTLQRALLAVPTSVPGVEFVHVYRSATEAAWVGGDFFDIFELPGRRVGIVIGDVSGKGVEASVLASFTRQLLKAHASEGSSLAAVMERTNDLVHNVSQPEDFVTVFLGVLSLDAGVLTFCSAGHPPPLLKREGRSRLLYDGGPILGAFSGIDYHERDEPVEPGDLIVLYTDGVIEAKRDGELFGDTRLLELVDSLPEATVRGLPGEMVERVTEFANGRLRDDVAILCVRRLPDV